MNFSDAFDFLHQGHKITRRFWKYEMYLKKVIYEHLDKEDVVCYLKVLSIFNFTLEMFTCKDWIVIGECEHASLPMALLYLKQGKIVKLPKWDATTYLEFDPINKYVVMHHWTRHDYQPNFEDLSAEDWEEFI